MAKPLPGSTLVTRVKMDRHHNVVLVGYGTAGAKEVIRVVWELYALGAGESILGVILMLFDEHVLELVRRLPKRLLRFAPREILNGLPDGFKNDPRIAAGCAHKWMEFVNTAAEEMRRASAQRGLSAGVVVHFLSPGGGHMEVCSQAVPVIKEHFQNQTHIGFYNIPDDSKNAQKNLRDYPNYPDSLDIPLALGSQLLRQQSDEAPKVLLSNLICGRRFVDTGQPTFIEAVAQLQKESRIIGLAVNWKSMPRIRVPFLDKIFGVIPGVVDQELHQALPVQMVELLTQAKGKTCPQIPNPAEGDLMFLGTGGLAIPNKPDPNWIRSREAFKESMVSQVQKQLELAHVPFPKYLTVTWSSTADVLPNNYLNIPAVLAYPLKGYCARSFIDPLVAQLDEDESDMPRRLLRQLPNATYTERG